MRQAFGAAILILLAVALGRGFVLHLRDRRR